MFKSLFKKKPKQMAYCYCPKCTNELVNSNSFVSDEEFVTYKCSVCAHETKWLFDAPVPILIEGE